MVIKSRSKNKKRNRKTEKRQSDDTLISKSVRHSINNPMVYRYSNIVKASPTIKNMKDYVKLIEIVTKGSLGNPDTYSPSINKRLESIRETTTTDIFGCGAESILKKTTSDNSFTIRVGEKRDGTIICVDATSKQARDVFMKNFKANPKLNPSNIIAPIQSHANCWFNCMFMCFFVSDKGRKFMRFFRQLMIEGKLSDGKPILPKSLATTFIMFNAAIEACYNIKKNDNYWLALNTNNIISNIYKSIPNARGIRNIDECGNPYYYYHYIMLYLDAKNNSIYTERYGDDNSVRNFYNSPNKIGVTPDIVVIALNDDAPYITAQAVNYKDKPIQVNYNGATYALDSVVSRDITKEHFCCGITCNGSEYIFDGGAFSKLSKRNWKSLINKDYNWGQKGVDLLWNFMRGYSMFFYYRIK
jgi:hypothetical protein